MNGYQGSDWFKSGVHLRFTEQDDRQRLIAQAAQQISECSQQLQTAYDGGLALFSDFTGTDAEVAQAQETLAAITAVRQSLHDLHKRLAPSLTHSTSDSSIDYVPSGNQQVVNGLAVLKAKEEQLQKEVNRCRCLTAENDLLQKQLQALRASSPELLGQSRSPADSIRAGKIIRTFSGSLEEVSGIHGSGQSVRLDGVKSLMHAGSWLQMLRAKLAGPGDTVQMGQNAADMDDTASLPGSRGQEEEEDWQPMRRSQSDQLHDRDVVRRSSRRGGELVRPSDLGPQGVTLASPMDRDQRRRTNVFMEDADAYNQQSADAMPIRHFLTPELAARSALFGGRT